MINPFKSLFRKNKERIAMEDIVNQMHNEVVGLRKTQKMNSSTLVAALSGSTIQVNGLQKGMIVQSTGSHVNLVQDSEKPICVMCNRVRSHKDLLVVATMFIIDNDTYNNNMRPFRYCGDCEQCKERAEETLKEFSGFKTMKALPEVKYTDPSSWEF